MDQVTPKRESVPERTYAMYTKELAKVKRLKEELRWYGHTLAGEGPICGMKQAANDAIDRWYEVTLPLLESKRIGEQ